MTEDTTTPDNLSAAMDKVAETLEPTVNKRVGTKDKPAQAQVLIRTTDEDRDRWKQAAEKCGVSMADFVRRVVDERVAELLDCPHPPHMVRKYPWSEQCLACGQRLK